MRSSRTVQTVVSGKTTQGEYALSFDLIDEGVPYLRRSPLPISKVDRGEWMELRSDDPFAKLTGAINAATVDRCAGDGDVRALLADLGVAKKNWETATSDTRRTVKRAVKAMHEIERAVADAVQPDDLRVAASAYQFLQRFLKLGLGESDKGYVAFAEKNSAGAEAKAFRKRLELLLSEVRQTAAEERQVRGVDPFALDRWVRNQAEAIAFAIGHQVPGGPRAAANACTPERLRRLRVSRAVRDIAQEITEECFAGVVSKEVIRRGGARRRNRNRRSE